MATFPRSVLVTGASRGLGLEFVKQMSTLPDAPDHLFAACRNPENATDLQNLATHSPKCKIHLLKLDVINDDEIRSAVEKVEQIVGENGLNLLLNNAGVLDRSQTVLGAVKRDALLESFNINVCGPMLTTQAFIPLLRKAAKRNQSLPSGICKAAMVSMSTGAASIADNMSGGKLGGYAYRTSKAAMNMATRCLAMDLKEDGILCVNILPGFVQTDMTGGKGNLTPEQSICLMLDVFRQFGESHNGGFYSYSGKEFPW